MTRITVDDCSFCMGETCSGYRLGLGFSLGHAERLQASGLILGLR